jgi:hypothetical protein
MSEVVDAGEEVKGCSNEDYKNVFGAVEDLNVYDKSFCGTGDGV